MFNKKLAFMKFINIFCLIKCQTYALSYSKFDHVIQSAVTLNCLLLDIF